MIASPAITNGEGFRHAAFHVERKLGKALLPLANLTGPLYRFLGYRPKKIWTEDHLNRMSLVEAGVRPSAPTLLELTVFPLAFTS